MQIIIVLKTRIFTGRAICFFVVYLTMLSTTQNIETNSRIITAWRAGTDVEGKGHGTVRRVIPELLWRWPSKTINNHSEVSIPDEPLWGHSEDTIKLRSLEPTRSVVQKPKFKRMTDDGHVPNTTQGGRRKHIQHSSRTHAPRSRQTSPGHMNCFSDLPYPFLIPEGHINKREWGGCMLHHTQHTHKQAVKQSGSNIRGLNNPLSKHIIYIKLNFFIDYVLKKRQTCPCERHNGILNPRKWMEFRGKTHATTESPPPPSKRKSTVPT